MTSLIDSLKDAPELTFAPGDVIIKQGGDLNRIFVLVDGEVEVVKGDVPLYKISKVGSTFGEMSALLGIKPTASILAEKASTFKVIENPEEFLSQHASATLEVARLLAHRVRWLTINYAAELDDGESIFWRNR